MTIRMPENSITENLLPTPEELQKEIPFTEKQAHFVLRARETIEAILNGWDKRRILIAGPCSIHDSKSAIEYAVKFSKLAEEVSDQFFLVMRTYFEKSRTIVGWKGMLYDPDIDGTHDVAKGIRQTRALLAELTDMNIPLACELLEINTAHYYTDFLTWGCIGARTSSSPVHRQLAATLNFPIGFKNSTDGNIEQAIHGVLSAASPHVYLGLSPAGQMVRVRAEGNPLCHLVLRGSNSEANYYPEAVQKAVQKCSQAKISDKVIIDCSHGNCGKKLNNQPLAFESIMEQICEGNEHIVGLMLESHLNGGAQEISFPLDYGVSITDPCISWETTEHLIQKASQLIRNNSAHFRDLALTASS